MKLNTITIAAILAASPAIAQQCGETALAYENLTNTYGEQRLVYGYTESGAIMEFWLSRESNSWTVIATFPDGTSCLVASGEDWGNDPAVLQPNL